MSPWDAFWALLGWIGLGVLYILVFFVAVIILIVVWGVIKGLLLKLFTKPPVERPTMVYDDYIREATVLGERLYGPSPNPSLEAFRAGARWGWHFYVKLH